MPRPRTKSPATPAKRTASAKTGTARVRRRSASTAAGVAKRAPLDDRAAIRHLALLGVTIVVSLLGLAIHVLWLVAIVLMAMLFGLIAATVRGRGVIPELVAEAHSVADDLTGGGD